MLNHLRSILSRPLETATFHMSGLIRRHPNIWAFGAQKRTFSCNPKHLFIYLSQLESEHGITPVWLTRNRALAPTLRAQGMRAYYIHSPHGIYYALTAGVYFINCDIHDISFSLSKNSRIINLWHGIPLKKIQFDNKLNERNNQRLLRRHKNKKFDRVFNPRDFVSYDYVLSVSSWMTQRFFETAFRVEPAQCISSGSPRTDLLYWEKSDIKSYAYHYEGFETKQLISWCESRHNVYVYMPTWRDSKVNFLQQSGIDFEDLDKILTARGDGMLVKLHPYTKINLQMFDQFHSIRLIDKRTDIYPILPFTDSLITDYSSIYFDYLCLRKPILFFSFDIDDYLSDCREMYFDYNKFTPGPKAYNYEELKDLIVRDEWKKDYLIQINDLREKVWGGYDGKCCEAITGMINSSYAPYSKKYKQKVSS